MLNILKKFIGTAQTRTLKKYEKIIKKVNEFDEKYKNYTEEELASNTLKFKERYKKNESLDSLLPEAYATVKAICRKLLNKEFEILGYRQRWDMVPYDVQILGAISMHFGSISEMQTGEGKTLTATMALYLNALTSKAVHLVTVNDYLAKRDCEWMGQIFKKLGLSVSSLTNDTPVHTRKEIYDSDIVYGTASEFGFDYLRDNSMATKKEEQVQRKPFYFAIVDEIDSILIDEARTPLIISGPAKESYQMYEEIKESVSKIVKMQRELCSSLASEARKILNTLDLLKEQPQENVKKLSKEEEEEKELALKKLWLVSKGTPRNKTLKKIKENPDLRENIEKLETYYYLDQNKKEKIENLSKLYIIVEERDSEYELTDKGIDTWAEDRKNNKDDFVMLDLGYEYLQIDNDQTLNSQEKIEKKNSLREEDSKRKERAHNLRQLFRAHLLMEKNVDYIVSEQKIVIIDENTGRPQPGRRFSDGLHQAIEAKENVDIQKETQTYATITLQNYFRMYEKLAGMTGTAITEANEFKEIYNLDVLGIPTYLPCVRKDLNDKIYMTEREKYSAIIKEIKEKNKEGNPILIGTESVEISEKLARILKQNNLSHTVLNAKNHEKEALIISQAGQEKAITLSTNMAGRGTDIKLAESVKNKKGLHVIGTCRHHSRRIDRQLRGRSGRLGDPGSSQFFVSFEDYLMRLFASDRLTAMLKKFRPPEGEPISAKILNKSIETAQKRIEQRNYNVRKHTLEYDDVINKQRKEIYSFRNDIMYSKNPLTFAKEILFDLCFFSIERSVNTHLIEDSFTSYCNILMEIFPVTFEPFEFKDAKDKEEMAQKAYDKISKTLNNKLEYQKEIIKNINSNEIEEERVEEILNNVLKNIFILKIDEMWQEHLLFIDHLRSDVHLRAIGQKDPLLEFKHESFKMFDQFSQNLKIEISKNLFGFEMAPFEQKNLQETISKIQLHKEKSYFDENNQFDENDQKEQEIEKNSPSLKIKRNEKCPCKSGKKYKKCCGKST